MEEALGFKLETRILEMSKRSVCQGERLYILERKKLHSIQEQGGKERSPSVFLREGCLED